MVVLLLGHELDACTHLGEAGRAFVPFFGPAGAASCSVISGRASWGLGGASKRGSMIWETAAAAAAASADDDDDDCEAGAGRGRAPPLDRVLLLRGGGGEEGEGSDEEFEVSIGEGGGEEGVAGVAGSEWKGCETVQCNFEKIGDTKGVLYTLGQRHAEETDTMQYHKVTGKRLFVNPAKAVRSWPFLPPSQLAHMPPCSVHGNRVE